MRLLEGENLKSCPNFKFLTKKKDFEEEKGLEVLCLKGRAPFEVHSQSLSLCRES